jgi:hypothetical protein
MMLRHHHQILLDRQPWMITGEYFRSKVEGEGGGLKEKWIGQVEGQRRLFRDGF